MDLNPFKITPIPGDKVITIKSDYLIEARFVDPNTGAVILDCTGSNAVLMSDLLEGLASAKLAAFVGQTAVPMVAIFKGLADG